MTRSHVGWMLIGTMLLLAVSVDLLRRKAWYIGQ